MQSRNGVRLFVIIAATTLIGCQAAPPSIGMAALRRMKQRLDADVDFSGRWRNQRGSTMTLMMDDAGRVTGEYTTKVGTNDEPFTRPFVGQAHGDQIVFYADYHPYSMTAWVGQLLTMQNGKELLETVWINTVNVEPRDEPRMGWSGVRSGGDVFERIE